MDKISYAVKINSDLVKKLKDFCITRGIKQGFFVEKALKEQLERQKYIEDVLDFEKLKNEEKKAISFEAYLKKRKKHV